MAFLPFDPFWAATFLFALLFCFDLSGCTAVLDVRSTIAELDTTNITQVIFVDLDVAGVGDMAHNADPGVVLIGWWVLTISWATIFFS